MKNIQITKRLFFNPAKILIPVLALSFTVNAQATNLKKSQQNSDSLTAQTIQSNSKDTVYNFADKMPEFPGGEKEVVKFLNQTMRYPEAAQKKNEHGKVIVQFVITKTGKVENAKVLKGVSADLDGEAIRVIGLLPDWIPGEQNGQKVSVYRIIPILFQSESLESTWQANEKTVVVIDNVKMPDNFNPSILNFDKFASVNLLKPFPEKEKSKLISKYGKMAENGVILLTSSKSEIEYALPDSTINPIKKEITPCKENAVLPVYPGGDASLLKYIADSIQYPFVAKRTKTEGKVLVRFMVDISGKVSDATIARTADYFLSKEAIRVINTLPNWTPGSQCNAKLNFYVTVPVVFKLDQPATEKKEWIRNKKTIVLLDGERLPFSFNLDWVRYENLTSYQVLQPTSKEVIKKLKSQYGGDAANGVILIGSRK